MANLILDGGDPTSTNQVPNLTQSEADGRYIRSVNNAVPDASGNVSFSAGVTMVAGKSGAVTLTEDDILNLSDDLAATERLANKGVANGYASLDSSGKLTQSQLPTITNGYPAVMRNAYQMAGGQQVVDQVQHPTIDLSVLPGGQSPSAEGWSDGGGAFFMHEPINANLTSLLSSGTAVPAGDTSGTYTYKYVTLVQNDIARGSVWIDLTDGFFTTSGHGLYIKLPFRIDTDMTGMTGVARGFNQFKFYLRQPAINPSSFGFWLNDNGGDPTNPGAPITLTRSTTGETVWVLTFTFTWGTGWFLEDTLEIKNNKAPWAPYTTGSPPIPVYLFRGKASNYADNCIAYLQIMSAHQLSILNTYGGTLYVGGSTTYVPGICDNATSAGLSGALYRDSDNNGGVSFWSAGDDPVSNATNISVSTLSTSTTTGFITLHEAMHMLDVWVPRSNSGNGATPLSQRAEFQGWYTNNIKDNAACGAYARTNSTECFAEAGAAYTWYKSQGGDMKFLNYVFGNQSSIITNYIAWMDSWHVWS